MDCLTRLGEGSVEEGNSEKEKLEGVTEESRYDLLDGRRRVDSNACGSSIQEDQEEISSYEGANEIKYTIGRRVIE